MGRAAGPCRRAIIHDGQIVGWETMKKSSRPKVRSDNRFVVWDDLCQAVRCRGSLWRVASYMRTEDAQYCVLMHEGGRGGLTPLTCAEKALVKRRGEE